MTHSQSWLPINMQRVAVYNPWLLTRQTAVVNVYYARPKGILFNSYIKNGDSCSSGYLALLSSSKIRNSHVARVWTHLGKYIFYSSPLIQVLPALADCICIMSFPMYFLIMSFKWSFLLLSIVSVSLVSHSTKHNLVIICGTTTANKWNQCRHVCLVPLM